MKYGSTELRRSRAKSAVSVSLRREADEWCYRSCRCSRWGSGLRSVFWIYVPTNIDLAANLKGKLLLETGDEDNNVHPANTIRVINALIQNNKRFDYMIYPGQPHAYGPMSGYAFQLQAEYFAEFLLGDASHRRSADFNKHGPDR